jgi:hypothetical protein
MDERPAIGAEALADQETIAPFARSPLGADPARLPPPVAAPPIENHADTFGPSKRRSHAPTQRRVRVGDDDEKRDRRDWLGLGVTPRDWTFAPRVCGRRKKELPCRLLGRHPSPLFAWLHAHWGGTSGYRRGPVERSYVYSLYRAGEGQVKPTTASHRRPGVRSARSPGRSRSPSPAALDHGGAAGGPGQARHGGA